MPEGGEADEKSLEHGARLQGYRTLWSSEREPKRLMRTLRRRNPYSTNGEHARISTLVRLPMSRTYPLDVLESSLSRYLCVENVAAIPTGSGHRHQ